MASDGRINNAVVNQVREKDYYGEQDREIKMSDGFNMAFGLI